VSTSTNAETRVFWATYASAWLAVAVMLGLLIGHFTSGWLQPSEPELAPIVVEEPSLTAIVAQDLAARRWTCNRTSCEEPSAVAELLVREAHRWNVEVGLLVGVMMVENPWLDSRRRSPAGAVGLMQVMPVHEGEWEPCGSIYEMEGNICTGVAVLKQYLDEAVRGALLRYNGCRSAHCRSYPDSVEARGL
jgi:hypothetical protein